MNSVAPVKISIITVCLNAREDLEGTLASISKQDYPHVEHIVIDGGSSDGSKQLLQNNAESRLSYFQSRPDQGIYDAMNQGLNKAVGDFIAFINAGDSLFDVDTLSKVAQAAAPSVDVVFGDVMFVDRQRRYLGLRTKVLSKSPLPRRLNWRHFSFGCIVSHQAFFVRRVIAPNFSLNNLSADIDWMIRCLKLSRACVRLEEPISEYLIGGVSTKRFFRSMFDRYQVLHRHFGAAANAVNHIHMLKRFIRTRIQRLFQRQP